jgi:hypothetical protein
MIPLSSRLIAAMFAITTVVSVGFAFQAKTHSQQQFADQTTAMATQIQATSAALGATAQVNMGKTSIVVLDNAVRQTATVQYALQGTQITLQVHATQQSELSAQNNRIIATQISARGTEVARDQMYNQTQVANAVRQTILAIPTSTPIPTITPLPTATPTKPKINVLIEGCTTGLDAIRRRLGEVTNAYVTVSNVGQTDVSGVVVTLVASDEASQHPDRQKPVQYLPTGHQITVDLATGTNVFDDTGIKVVVTTREGVVEQASRSDCKEIDPETLDSLARVLRLVVPIPRLPIVR